MQVWAEFELASEGLDSGHHAGPAILLAKHRRKAALHRQKGTPRQNTQRPSLPEEELPQGYRDGEDDVAVVHRARISSRSFSAKRMARFCWHELQEFRVWQKNAILPERIHGAESGYAPCPYWCRGCCPPAPQPWLEG